MRTALIVVALGVIGAGSPALAMAQEAGPAEAAPVGTAPAEAAPAEAAPVETAPAEAGTADVGDPVAAADKARDDAARASDSVMRVLTWVTQSGDNEGLPFMVIDKVASEVFVFSPEGEPLGATPALLGSAAGDDSAPGVGDRELSAIPPEERTTPAGRFLAEFGHASGNRKVLWVDYADAISLHPVVTTNKKEQRLARLYSPTADDNRITFGCINISATVYQKLVQPLFTGKGGIVYILPDTKSLDEVFPSLRTAAMPRAVAAGAR